MVFDCRLQETLLESEAREKQLRKQAVLANDLQQQLQEMQDQAVASKGVNESQKSEEVKKLASENEVLMQVC